MAMHSVLVSIIFVLTVKKFLFEVLHFVYHTIDVLEKRIVYGMDEILPFYVCTLMGPFIEDLYFPVVMALLPALAIGKLLVPVVVVHAGAKVGSNLVEKLVVNPVENIREYLIDPIEEYVEERSAEHDAVFEKYVVVPIGDCVAGTIKNCVLAPIRKCGTEMAPIREYLLALIQKYMLSPIQKYEIEMAPIREYVLAPIREYVVAPIQRQYRKLRCKRKIRKVRDQIENLRKIREVVVKAVDAAQEKGEVTLPNVPEWLTSANGITEASMDDVERVVELYFERLEPLKSKRV